MASIPVLPGWDEVEEQPIMEQAVDEEGDPQTIGSFC